MTEQGSPREHPSGLIRHSVYNLLGQMMPMVVAAIAIPIAVSHMGVERFALLSLSWSILAYVTVFDLGIGRATTHLIARETGEDASQRRSDILRTSIFADFLVGVLLAIILQPIVEPLVRVLKVPDHLLAEATGMLRLLSLSVPILTLGGTLRAALEGEQRFGYINAVKGPFNSLLFLIPAVGAYLEFDLDEIVMWIVISRSMLVLMYGAPLVIRYPRLIGFRTSASLLRNLFGYGGWVTLSNVLAPMIAFGERLIVPALLSVGVLSYYTAPYEMISRVAVIPFSIMLASFPRLSAAFRDSKGDTWKSLVAEPMLVLHFLITPIVGFVLAFSPDILELWMGTEFSLQGGTVLQILAMAFYINGFSYVLLAAVQGMGRPDLKAKLDAGNTVAFLLLCALGVRWLGIEGAALAKLAAFLIDAGFLYYFSRMVSGVHPNESAGRREGWTWALSIGFLASSVCGELFIHSLPLRLLFFGALVVGFGLTFLRTHKDARMILWMRDLPWLKSVHVLMGPKG